MGHKYGDQHSDCDGITIVRDAGRSRKRWMVVDAMDILTFVERSNAAESPGEVMGLFQTAALEFGYTKIAYLGVTGDAEKDLCVLDPELRPLIACTYPREYLIHYKESDYIDCDPALTNALRMDVPFLWDHVESGKKATRKQKMLASDGRAAGLWDGVTVPLHGALGRSYAVCLARDDPDDGDDRHHFSDLHILATQFHQAYARVARSKGRDSPPPRLSERERECLKWTAIGKSAWAIGMILGLSEQTVNAYMKSAMKKLNACNRVSAVVHAIQFGLIAP
jgi:DNA-binding CsgD family transcriptional regulator